MGQQDILAEAARLLDLGEPFVLATLVDARGSTPQRVGARLLVRRDGSTLGTLGGGCIEADVWHAAIDAMATGESRLLDFTLTEDIAVDYGLSCGGSERILVDPTLRGTADAALMRALARAAAGDRRGVLLTRLDADGAGADRRLAVWDGRPADGDLGLAQAEALEAARGILAETQPAPRLLRLTDGTELFAEVYDAPPDILIVGGGHIGKALADLAALMGLRFSVVDDRAQFASRERFPAAESVIAGDIERAVRDYTATPATSVVIVTRGHKYDYQALAAAVRSPAGYVGLMGSRRKVALIYRQLLADGVPEERLRDVHAPIGLDIGAVSPEEIALAIMAEITMHRRGRTGGPLRDGGRLVQSARRRARS